MRFVTEAQMVRPGDFVTRWNDTVADVRDNGNGTVTVTTTNDGERHIIGAEMAVTVERGAK